MEAGYRIPSNAEITDKLDTAQHVLEETKHEQKRNLTADGKKIIDVTERIMDDTKAIVHEKNPNDLMQQIVFEGQKFYKDLQVHRSKWYELHKLLENPTGDFDSKALLNKLDSMTRAAKLLAIELVSSGEFRQTIIDFFSVLYTQLVDAANLDRVGKPLKEAYENMNVSKEKAKEKLKEAGENAVQMGLDFADKDKSLVTLTEDQKKELWARIKTILNTLSTRERSQRIFKNFFDIVDMLYQCAEDVSCKVTATSQKLANDKHLNNILNMSQQLFEAVSRTSLDPVISQLKVIYASFVNDEEFRRQWYRLREWLLKVLENPDLLNAENAYDEYNEIMTSLNKSFAAKTELNQVFRVLNEECYKILYTMEEDPLATSLQCNIKELVQTVLLDDKGRVTFKPEVLDQLKLIIVSSVVGRLRFPLPEVRCDDKDSSFAFRISGLILNIQDILPERIIAENYGLAVLNVKDKTAEKSVVTKVGYNQPLVDKAGASVRIKMENINVHIPDADVWFHKRTFPEMEDTGKCSVDIPGRGMDLTFTLRGDASAPGLFVLVKVDCDIHELNLTLADTRHDTIYNMMISLFKGRAKANIEEAIQESMIGVFENLNNQIARQVSLLRSTIPSVLGSTH